MTKGQILEKQLNNVLSGQPWYGKPIYGIIEEVSFEAAFEKPGAAAHNVAEILLHMISWAEETIDHMNEKPAGVPLSGDWPETGEPSEEKWQRWKEDFKLVNVNLLRLISNFPEENWDGPIIDTRDSEPVTTYAELVDGLMQHQIYHAGQIALLNKLVNGR